MKSDFARSRYGFLIVVNYEVALAKGFIMLYEGLRDLMSDKESSPIRGPN